MQWPVAVEGSGALDVVIQSIVGCMVPTSVFELIIGPACYYGERDHGRREGRYLLARLSALL